MTLDLLVITNAVTDRVYTIPAAELEALGLKKGSERRTKDPQVLGERLAAYPLQFESPAGSPANVGFSSAVLGLRVGIIGCVGSDALGAAYKQKVADYGMQDHLATASGESGVCYTFITEDGERTFLNLMNAAPTFNLTSAPRQANVIHTSCYEMAGRSADFIPYFERAKKEGVRISLDLANPQTCSRIGDNLATILEMTDILFASPEEYEAAIGKPFTTYDKHPFRHRVMCLKFGNKGSRVITPNSEIQIPIVPTTVVNTNGAGDSYAAGFLRRYIRGDRYVDCGRYGSEIASRVVGQVGACLPFTK